MEGLSRDVLLQEDEGDVLKMANPRTDISKEPVLERIMDQLSSQRRSEKDLTDYLGLANGTFTKWKYKNGRSYFKYIREIADYLDVTPGYLLHGQDDELTYETLSGNETRLLTMYRKLDESGQGTVMDVVGRFAQAVAKT